MPSLCIDQLEHLREYHAIHTVIDLMIVRKEVLFRYAFLSTTQYMPSATTRWTLNCHLVSVRERKLGKLERVRPREAADGSGVGGGMDVGVVVAGDGLEGEGGRVARLVP